MYKVNDEKNDRGKSGILDEMMSSNCKRKGEKKEENVRVWKDVQSKSMWQMSLLAPNTCKHSKLMNKMEDGKSGMEENCDQDDTSK